MLEAAELSGFQVTATHIVEATDLNELHSTPAVCLVITLLSSYLHFYLSPQLKGCNT
jgi:hypothetical protein